LLNATVFQNAKTLMQSNILKYSHNFTAVEEYAAPPQPF